VPLRASISEERLRSYLIAEVATRYDQPATPAQPVAGTTAFTPGIPGRALDVDGAVPVIADALRSAAARSVTLPAREDVAASRASLTNLGILLRQVIAVSGFDGVIGLYMADLQNGQEVHFALNQGQEIAVEPDLPFTASSTMKIPILVSFFVQHGGEPVDDSTAATLRAMILQSDNPATDRVMELLEPNRGPLVVTENLQQIGLENSFIAGFFCSPQNPCELLRIIHTPANSRTDSYLTEPDVYNQTTPSDMGILLQDLYQCSQAGGGALVAAFPSKFSQDVCDQIINFLEQDRIGRLLQAGVPEGTKVAMKHGWTPRCFGCALQDISVAGIVYTPGGNFVLSIYTYAAENPFDPTNQLIADLTRSVYNYYNTTAAAP
jgi:beta-lactamase class A